jgi:hypothetical protein
VKVLQACGNTSGSTLVSVPSAAVNVKRGSTLAGAKLYSAIIVTVIILVLELRWLPEVYFLAQRPT